MKRIISGLMIVVWLSTIVGGCNQSPSTASADLKQTTENSENETQKAWILEDGAAKQSLLNANMTLPQVAVFADTLASWGYSYRAQNSLVMVAAIFEAAEDAPALEKRYPDHPDSVRKNLLVEQDTVVWQVFENAAFDSSKHTAVITGYHDGRTASIFVEIDVSTDSMNLIRGWVVGDSGSVTPPEFNSLWQDYGKCVTVCALTCAVVCALTGPGWIACFTSCGATCLPGCVIKLMFESIFDLFS